MADPLEAAAEAIVGSRLGWRANLSIEEARPAVAECVTAYLDSLLGELPEEAVEAAKRYKMPMMTVNPMLQERVREEARRDLRLFLTALRDSLVSGREGKNDV